MKEVYYPTSRNDKPVKWLCVGAHQDDAEIMAIDGILKGYSSNTHSFSLVVTTDGGGSSRKGAFKDYTDEEMIITRRKEQIEASELGKYHSLYLLNHTSNETKDLSNQEIEEEYINIIKELKPEVIYTHNLFDKHATHVAVAVHLINALRRLDKKDQPKYLYGCEVWRGLDWVNDDSKVAFDVSHNITLQKQLLNVFKSQNEGKAYNKAAMARRKMNATYYKSHELDQAKLISFALDLTPLLDNPHLSIEEYISRYIKELENAVIKNVK